MSKLQGSESIIPIITKTIWTSWVLVCGVSPVLLSISELILFEQDFSKLHINLTQAWCLIFALPLAPSILQCFVLHRFAPRLSYGAWFFSVSTAGIISLSWKVWVDMYFLQPQISAAILKLKLKASVRILDILTLPWPIFFLITSIGAVAIYFLPTLALAKSTKQSWFIFISAAIIASLTTSFVEHIYHYFHFPTPMGIYSGNEKYIVDLALIFSAGALWGAISGVCVTYKFNTAPKERAISPENYLEPITVSFMIAVTMLVLLLPLVSANLVNPKQLSSSIAAVQKAISIAPDKDISTDENILSFSHTADVDTPEFPVIKFALDNKLFLIRNEKSELNLVDLITGKLYKKLYQLEAAHTQYEAQWSTDGKYFVLRESWQEYKAKFDLEWQSRLRLYSLPEYTLISEYDECSEAHPHVQSMVFEFDNSSLWITCHQLKTKEKGGLVKLALPTLKAIDIRHYTEDTKLFPYEYRDVARARDGVIAWQEGNPYESVLITDLTHNKKLALLPNLTNPDRAGSLTMQSGRTTVDDNQINLIFCGNSSQVSDPQKKEIGKPMILGFCRTLVFDIFSGELLKKSDEVNNLNLTTNSVFPVKNHNFQVISEWEKSSKDGVIKVVDASSRRELQKIETVAQRILSLSTNGHWLFTHALNSHTIRIYKVNL